MTNQNLSIVFGPTLFGQIVPTLGSNGQLNGGGMADASFQNIVSAVFISAESLTLTRGMSTGNRDDPGSLYRHLR